jgi:hypothetical protein
VISEYLLVISVKSFPGIHDFVVLNPLGFRGKHYVWNPSRLVAKYTISGQSKVLLVKSSFLGQHSFSRFTPNLQIIESNILIVK